MSARLISVSIEHETDVVLVRQRARQVAELLGFEKQDQTRITTAVSEIARNAFDYGGGGRAEFLLHGNTPPQLLEVVVSDAGRGIPELERILAGAHHSRTGMGLGILGARRLMDQFEIECEPGGGTTVSLRKFLPAKKRLIGAAELRDVASALARPDTFDPMTEIRRQNQELLVSLEEISQRHDEVTKLNEELEDTNRGVVALYAELDERADHLRRADDLKSKFLSNMSHEFRTPLNSILALSRLLLDRTDGELTPEQEKQIRFMRKAAENLTELVNDLLDLAKVEAGKIDVRPTEFSIESLFGTLRGMLRPLLVGESVALVFESADQVPAAFTDEGKVSQILRNFISNALKFTDQGEVRVSAQLATDGTWIAFSVTDTGIGIPAEHHETIFQEFVQLDNPAQRRYKGTGLGLPLSRKLAELLGGRISIESAPGKGSTFSLHLPLAYAQAPDAVIAEIDAEAATAAGDRPALLAIEDSPEDILIYERAFHGTPYRLLSARTAAEARRVLRTVRPAAIFLDLMLFGEDSWQLLSDLKRDPAIRRIPVIVVSTIDDEAKARKIGSDRYLLKPVTSADLNDALRSVLAEKSRTRVLLIEDEEAFRYAIRQFLPAAAYETIEVGTGLEGLRLARELRPDIILLDLNLPETDGFSLLAQFSEDTRTRDLPVIIVTSADLDDRATARLRRARRILSKAQLSTSVLVGCIVEALKPPAEELRDA